MRFLCCLLLSTLLSQVLFARPAAAEANQRWTELRTKREALKSFHKEFEVSRTYKTGQHDQASKWSAVVDGSAARWRERSVSGAGDRVTVFDGKDQFEFESEGEEYIRLKRSSKEPPPQPGPYSDAHLDLSKAVERDRRPCGLNGLSHDCITLDIPVRPSIRSSVPSNSSKVTDGTMRAVFDTVTGLLVSSRTVQNIEESRGGYQSDTTYILKKMSYDGDMEAGLFHVPSTATKEVKELSKWDANKLKKQLAGKTAPDFQLTDLQGKTIKLSELKGQTVLLDFWATWCGPCREDGPSLDKLYQKYGGKSLAIIGVSVNEERAVVEKFLREHAHQYSIALTTENEMPEPYRIGVFPTYIVIDSDGNVAAATEGSKGFSELRRLLKKSGLDTD